MIELGTIPIRNETSIVEARNKIRILAEDLELGSVTATRMATVTSELSRRMVAASQMSDIRVALDQRDGAFGLVLLFISGQPVKTLDVDTLKAVFDDVEIAQTAGGLELIGTFKFVPVPEFEPMKDVIDKERQLVQPLTREELYLELKEYSENLEEMVEERTTELRDAQDRLQQQMLQLVQAEKMNALGTMAAGISHELLNPMMGMLNFTEYCLERTAEDDPRHRVLQNMERETERCADIAKSLLAFSRTEKPGEEEYQRESLAVIIDRAIRLLSYRIDKEHVLLTKYIAEGTPEVWMDASRMQQVFINVINNALDAVEESAKKEIRVEAHPEGEFVLMRIADSGCGIPPENMGKIFDHFFTTKPVGQRTGLGLTISQNIILEHGGSITCESKPDTGTVFSILLPTERTKKGGQNG